MRLPRRLLSSRNPAIIVRLVHKENDRQKTETSLNRVDPKWPRPSLSSGDEGGEERSHVWTENDETRPDIDLASPFVEEEKVVDEHPFDRLLVSLQVINADAIIL